MVSSIRKQKWNAPLRQRIPSVVATVLAVLFALLVAVAYRAPTLSPVFSWIVNGDQRRSLGAPALSIILILCAVGTTVRARMRGVLVGDRWLEARYLLPGGVPRSRRWTWEQIERIVVRRYQSRNEIVVELPTGHRMTLPEVQDGESLANALDEAARRHGFEVDREGG